MTSSVAVKTRTQIARPLAVLVPLIKGELVEGNRAGLEHYRRAGEMLLEARDGGQVAAFKFSRWLSKNFNLSRSTAYYYMDLANKIREDPKVVQRAGQQASLRSLTGQKPANVHWRPVINATKQIDVDPFVETRQARDDEVQLHRDLALELIDIGYKALATRLHPDRGGSRDAMRRLNRVREELNTVAKMRRFE